MHLIYWHIEEVIFTKESCILSAYPNTQFIVCETWSYVYYRDLHKAYRKPTPFYYVPIARNKMVPLSKAASSDTSLACQVTAINGETADVKASWHQSIWVEDFPVGKKVPHYTLYQEHWFYQAVWKLEYDEFYYPSSARVNWIVKK